MAWERRMAMVSIRRCFSPLGGITLAARGEALCGLWFDGQRFFGENLGPDTVEEPLPVLLEAERWLEIFFRGADPGFTPPLAPAGSPFRRAVWDLLLAVPFGETVTYGELAGRLAARTGLERVSARAVGGAVAHNPISLIIPCHRVLGAGGSLTGYAGGLERKRRLLALEQAGARHDGH